MNFSGKRNITALRWHYGEIKEIKLDNGDLKDVNEIIDMAGNGELNDIPSSCLSVSSLYNHIKGLKNLVEL